MIGHHHTYSAIDSADFQILAEADFLVNIEEDGASNAADSFRQAEIFQNENRK